jgi:hypothetical protein
LTVSRSNHINLALASLYLRYGKESLDYALRTSPQISQNDIEELRASLVDANEALGRVNVSLFDETEQRVNTVLARNHRDLTVRWLALLSAMKVTPPVVPTPQFETPPVTRPQVVQGRAVQRPVVQPPVVRSPQVVYYQRGCRVFWRRR